MLSHKNKKEVDSSNYQSIISMIGISEDKSILSVLMPGEGKTADKCMCGASFPADRKAELEG